MRIMAIQFAVVAVVAFATFGMPRHSFATIQSGMCWEPDVEYPVPCDDIDED